MQAGTISIVMQVIVPLVSMAIGAGICWGILRQKMEQLEKRLGSMEDWQRQLQGVSTGESLYMPRTACRATHKDFATRIDQVETQNGGRDKALTAVQNFVRWYLIEKEHLPVDRVNAILNGE